MCSSVSNEKHCHDDANINSYLNSWTWANSMDFYGIIWSACVYAVDEDQMTTATIIQFLYSSFLVKFYFQLFQEKTRVLFFNQQMEPEGEISSAPRTIDSCWINNLWKQNPRKSFQKSFKRLLMCLLRSFIFALCFAKLSISSPIRTIKVAEMSASQSWEINGKKGGNPNELSLRLG